MSDQKNIGVELEFAGLDGATAAALVVKRFGGNAENTDVFRWEINAPRLGHFVVELDTKYVHKGEAGVDLPRDARQLIGDLSAGIVPVEIVAPPITRDRIVDLDKLLHDLRDAGAEGSDAHPLYAFGLHLNIEQQSGKAEDVWAVLKAFALIDPWLRLQIDVDVSRNLLPHIDPYPKAYVMHLVKQKSAPSWNKLIDDYLRFNPTRNRALDMLPMFAHVDEKRVRGVIDDPRIKPRPAYHYRLPQCDLGDPSFSITRELKRWDIVEDLACDAEKLQSLCAAYLEENEKLFGHWQERLTVLMDEWGFTS